MGYRNSERQRAADLGETRFEGTVCKKHQQTTRLVKSNKCVICNREYVSNRYHTNPEYNSQQKEASSQAYQRVGTAWYHVNKSRAAATNKKWREENRTHFDQFCREWRRNNPAKLAANANRYRASLLRAIPLWADLKEISRMYEMAHDQGLTIDHIVPLSSTKVCGLHCIENLQMVDRSTNCRKGNRYWPDMSP